MKRDKNLFSLHHINIFLLHICDKYRSEGDHSYRWRSKDGIRRELASLNHISHECTIFYCKYFLRWHQIKINFVKWLSVVVSVEISSILENFKYTSFYFVSQQNIVLYKTVYISKHVVLDFVSDKSD
jgi:hypothetical protein